MFSGDEMKKHFAERIGVPEETVSDVPLTQIRARRSVCVENHRGILEYTDVLVKIAVRRGAVTVHGADLAVARMTRRLIEIRGNIRAVELE